MNALSDNARVLRSVAARIVGDSDADDVVQETFLRALTSPPADTDSPIRPWLVTVARHVAIDWLRKHGRVELAEVEEVADEAEPPARGRLASLLAGLGRLSEGEVVVLLLRDALDLSVDHVADALGSTPGTVRVLHVRARRKANAAAGLDEGGLVALERFLTWLLAREVAGLPVRARAAAGTDPAFDPGVMEAHGLLLDAVVEAASAAGRPDLEARARLSRGSLRRATAPEAALDDLRRAVALGGESPMVGWWISVIQLNLGRLDEAALVAEEALASAVDPKVRGHLHQHLAFVHTGRGDLEAARSHAAAAHENGGPLAALARGNEHLFADRCEEARVEYLVFLASARERGRPMEEIVAAINLGGAVLDLEGEQSARRWYEHALALTRRHGDRMREVTAVGNIATLDRAEGRYPEAAEGFARAIELARATGRPAAEELYRMNAGMLDHLRGRLERAASDLAGVMQRQSDAGIAWDAVATRLWLTAVEAELGRAGPEVFREVRQALAEVGQVVHVAAIDVLEVLADLESEPGRERARARIAATGDRRSAVKTAVAIVRSALERRVRG